MYEIYESHADRSIIVDIAAINDYKHYIIVNADGLIVDGWSSGPLPNKDVASAICINDHGRYQFRLDDGPANPQLFTMSGKPRYRWDGKQAILIDS